MCACDELHDDTYLPSLRLHRVASLEVLSDIKLVLKEDANLDPNDKTKILVTLVKDKCQEIMEDVDKFDNTQGCFIHYQLILFFQATRLQYLNGQVQLANKQAR